MTYPIPRADSQNKDIGADKPGRRFDSRGQGRHALGAGQEPKEHVAEQFAKQLNATPDDGRSRQR